jgi:threonine dehydratase
VSRSEPPLTIDEIQAAQRRIAGIPVRTPLVPSPALRARVGSEVALKLESVQPTGAFKVRGAASRILALEPQVRTRGVVTASTGNHGRAVAHVAREVGIPAAVCVSERVPAGKIAALEATGCELVVGGTSQTEALGAAARLVDERGMTLVHPIDDREVIAGQGTIGLELLEDAPDLATALVPLSGGGLISGVALALKSQRPEVRVVGVSMERAPVMAASLDAGHPIELDEASTLADSLQGGIGGDGNRHTFAMVRDLVDDIVLLSEDEIWSGMRFALEEHRLVLEGAGAVGIAALLAGRVGIDGPTAVVCSGANAESDHIAALARGEAAPTG